MNSKMIRKAAALIAMTLALALPCPLTLQAQRHNPHQAPHAAQPAPHRGKRHFNPAEFRQKVRTFITREAALTQAEADIVFPLFFEMKDAQRQLKHRIDNACRRVCTENLSERDCQRLLEEVQRMQRQIAEYDATFCKKLRQRGIPASKILHIKAADEKFRRSTFRNATHQPRK